MSPAELVRALWERMESGDWEGARATLADGYISDNPVTGEQFASADSFLAMNRGYPAGWKLTIDELVTQGQRVAARLRISLGGKVLHCLSFIDVEGNRIVRSSDFWISDRRTTRPPADEPSAGLTSGQGTERGRAR